MDSVLSISELRKCMTYLGFSFHDDIKRTFDASFINSDGEYCGSIPVIFNVNPHSNAGPFIDLDIYAKGYGIQFSEFKPQFQEFTFKNSDKRLEVKGDGYKFNLEFE